MPTYLKNIRRGAAVLAAAFMLTGLSPSFVAFAQVASPAPAAAALPEPATIKALQDALTRQGIAVTADGVLSEETRAAIRRYQSQHHLPVTGEPDKATPQLQASFFQLVANPKWRVPESIAAKEIATKGSGWLAANNFAFEDGKYVQQSGPKNSLGLVKFDMEDKQQIYLHDTPAKPLFSEPERHRSHGCIRVQNALEFAGLLASQDGVAEQLQKALASGDETWVKLKTEIPVRLLYHTVFWDGSRVQFRPDVYGLDDVVGAALGLVRGPVRKPWEQKGEDVGP